MVRNLNRLIEDEALRHEMGENAYHHVTTTFTANIMASKYQRLYEEMK